MKLFLDTADVSVIREFASIGIVDGVTTNPSLIAKVGRPIRDVIHEICQAVAGPVSAEVTAMNDDGMVAEGERLADIASNVVVKVPSTWDGFKACRALSQRGRKVNVTLCFSANQALLAAKAGAAFVSPFVGRLDDLGQDGIELIGDIRMIYDNDDAFSTEILASSIRTPLHVTQAAMAGADVATIPPGVLRKLAGHPLTEHGVASFLADWIKNRAGDCVITAKWSSAHFAPVHWLRILQWRKKWLKVIPSQAARTLSKASPPPIFSMGGCCWAIVVANRCCWCARGARCSRSARHALITAGRSSTAW